MQEQICNMEAEESAQVVSTCDDCGEDQDVQEYCLDCHGKLCKNCKQKHLKKKLTCHHRVLSLTHPQSIRDRQSASVPCINHPENVYSTFCKTCQFPCCSDCMMLSHNKHEFLSIEEAAELSREKTSKYTEALKDYCDKDLPTGIDKIEDRIANVATKRKQYKGEIREKVDTLRKTLEEYEGKMNEEVDEFLNSEENALKTMLFKVKDNKETISSVMNTCEQRLQLVSHLQILTLPSEVPDISTLLLPSTALEPEVTLGISKFELSSVHEVIGKSTKATKRDTILEKVSSRHDPGVVVLKTVHSITAEGSPSKIFNTQKEEMWARSDSVIQKYDIYNPGMFKFILGGGGEGSKSTITLSVDLYDICMNKSNVLLGTDQSSKRVVTISDKGEVATLHDVSPFVPFGIFINEKQEIFVGVSSENITSTIIKRQIMVFSSEGKSGEVRYEMNALRQPLFHHYVHRITQTTNGDCVVVDGSNRVVCIGQNKYVKWTYQGIHISDVTYDSNNRIFICDIGKNEIVALCMKGCRLSLQFYGGSEKEIKKPISLGRCKSGIVVGEEGNRISVWQ